MRAPFSESPALGDWDSPPFVPVPDVTFYPTEEEEPDPALFGPDGEPLAFVRKQPFGFNRE